jgi:predicted transcriptional regulator
MTSITIELDDELRALVDKARGSLDPNEYARTALEEQARNDVATQDLSVAELTPGLTPADHMRLVAEARQPGRTMSVEEVKVAINAKYAHVLDEGEDAA